MNIRDISLAKLVPSPANARKTGASIGIDELAASIAAHGLLQNLQVRPGNKGTFEVVAGRRRLAALKLLAKRKAIAKTAEIACNVLDDEDATEISLAENLNRVAMHPADQFEAFYALAQSGKGPEEIAARFGVTATVVKQRLKLACVSPKLIELYRAEEMTLDQLMAFTVSDDHAAQETAWQNLPDFNRDPAAIRRALTESQVEADDSRVVFVGLDGYRAAGGEIVRDLFQPEHEGYLTDPALLDRLVTERLQREAGTVRIEGWKWVEIMPTLDYAALRGFGQAEAERLPLSEEQSKEIERLTAEYEGLLDEHGEDPEPEIAVKLDALQARIDTLSEGPEIWPPEVIAQSGAVVALGRDGGLRIERGLVRPEDMKDEPTGESEEPVAAKVKGSGAEREPQPSLSARLIEDLTAQRTAALRVVLAGNPAVALAAVAHAMALPVFYGSVHDDGTCLDLRVTSADLAPSAEGIGDGPAARALAERQTVCARQLPQEPEKLWDWLLVQDSATLLGLLAFVAASTVNAVTKPHERADTSRLVHADRLATALGLDMAQWWQPTAAAYLGRVSKKLILEAVTEGVSPEAADNLSGLKKDALIATAGERLAGTGWLPTLLRASAQVQPEEMPAAE